MRVIVHGRNTHVPVRLKDHATKKLEKVTRYFDRIQTMEIEFSEEHNPRIADKKHTVDVVLTTKRHVIRAQASGPDAASAVDAVEDKVEAQVRRLKDKYTRRGSRVAARFRRGGRRTLEPVPDLAELDLPDARNGAERPISSESQDGDAARTITKVTRFAVKPMTAEEAILQLQTLNRDFFLFVNAESDQAGVVYRRDDGSYGLIEPE